MRSDAMVAMVLGAAACSSGLVLACGTAAPETEANLGQVSSAFGAPPQGLQSNTAYAASYAASNTTNVFATTAKVSCFTPEVPASFIAAGASYAGTAQTPCPGATTGEDLGPYPSQVGSNPGYPASGPMLVNGHSESDIQIDPTNGQHLIGSSKWFTNPSGYNHQLGFYESFDGGKTWPVQGHIPGYEGWSDTTDPVGAFDRWGNYYNLVLPYEFYYNADYSKSYSINQKYEPNPTISAELIAVSVRKHGSTTARDWSTANGTTDIVAAYDSKGIEPDKQWITIDNYATSPFRDRIYTMWVAFTATSAKPLVSYATALPDGTHTPWTAPNRLPWDSQSPTGATYLLPHVTPDGTVWTTLSNFAPKQQYTYAKLSLIKSTDGGATFSVLPTNIAENIIQPPANYTNTTFREGILNSFATGSVKVNGHYPLYAAWEDYSAGITNILLTASFDDGNTWSAPVRANDNTGTTDALQPVLAAAPDGRVSLAFYDRRLPCPAQGSAEATGAALVKDDVNPAWAGSLPPYGAANYCLNMSVQFYDANLTPRVRNVSVSKNTFDAQLAAPHPSSPTRSGTFIGDYFGNAMSTTTNYFTFVSTYNDGSNPRNIQQQLVAAVPIP